MEKSPPRAYPPCRWLTCCRVTLKSCSAILLGASAWTGTCPPFGPGQGENQATTSRRAARGATWREGEKGAVPLVLPVSTKTAPCAHDISWRVTTCKLSLCSVTIFKIVSVCFDRPFFRFYFVMGPCSWHVFFVVYCGSLPAPYPLRLSSTKGFCVVDKSRDRVPSLIQ